MGQAMIMRRGGNITPQIPDGDTVLPINHVDIWLKCAGLPPSGLGNPTLAQVMDSADMLASLMVSANAVNYMIRSSTIWGAALASTKAKTAMDNSNPFVNPQLTSNNDNGYVASASSNASTAYKITRIGEYALFGSNSSAPWTAWASIRLPFSINPYRASIFLGMTNYGRIKAELQGGMDEAGWVRIAPVSPSVTEAGTTHVFQVDTAGTYNSFRIVATATSSHEGIYPSGAISRLQIYGKKRETV